MIGGAAALLGIGYLYYNYMNEEETEAILKEEGSEPTFEVYPDSVLISVQKRLNRDSFPIFHVLQLKAESVKQEMLKSEGKLPEKIDEIMFMMLTRNDPYYMNEMSKLINKVLTEFKLDSKTYDASVKLRAQSNPEIVKLNKRLGQALSMAIQGKAVLPDLDVREFISPQQMIELMLKCLKETLDEYLDMILDYAKQGKPTGGQNPEFISAMNLASRPAEIRAKHLLELGLDKHEEYHEQAIYTLAVQRYNKQNLGGVAEQTMKINRTMQEILTGIVIGSINIDNVVQKKEELTKFVENFFTPTEEAIIQEEKNEDDIECDQNLEVGDAVVVEKKTDEDPEGEE